MAWLGRDGMMRPEEVGEERLGEVGVTREVIVAWETIRRGVQAGVKLAARYVIQAREELAKAEKCAADAAVEFAQVERNFDEGLK